MPSLCVGMRRVALVVRLTVRDSAGVRMSVRAVNSVAERGMGRMGDHAPSESAEVAKGSGAAERAMPLNHRTSQRATSRRLKRRCDSRLAAC